MILLILWSVEKLNHLLEDLSAIKKGAKYNSHVKICLEKVSVDF